MTEIAPIRVLCPFIVVVSLLRIELGLTLGVCKLVTFSGRVPTQCVTLAI